MLAYLLVSLTLQLLSSCVVDASRTCHVFVGPDDTHLSVGNNNNTFVDAPASTDETLVFDSWPLFLTRGASFLHFVSPLTARRRRAYGAPREQHHTVLFPEIHLLRPPDALCGDKLLSTHRFPVDDTCVVRSCGGHGAAHERDARDKPPQLLLLDGCRARSPHARPLCCND